MARLRKHKQLYVFSAYATGCVTAIDVVNTQQGFMFYVTGVYKMSFGSIIQARSGESRASLRRNVFTGLRMAR